MNSRAQAGLEYLLTYGWAFILVATIMGILVFAFQAPSSATSFSSDDTRLMFKSGRVSPGGGEDSCELVLQNLAGSDIEVTSISASGDISADSPTVNGSSLPVTVAGGDQIHIQGLDTGSGGNIAGSITIEYTDSQGLERTASVNAGGGTGEEETGGGSEAECGNAVLEGSEVCDSGQQSECSYSTGYFSDDYVEDGVICSEQYACNADCTDCIPEVSMGEGEGCSACFAGSTMVSMANGAYKKAEEIETGDAVLYYDFEEGKTGQTTVTKVNRHPKEEMCYTYYLVINQVLRVTPNHPLDRPDGSTVQAGELQEGDMLQGETGQVEVFSIEKVQEQIPTYAFETESGRYIIDGISDPTAKPYYR